MHHRIAVGFAAVLMCAAAASASHAFDGSEARSRLIAGRAVATNFSIRIGEYQAMAEAAKRKYGPRSKTVLRGNSGEVVTTVDGKVVASEHVKARVREVFGLFSVGPRRGQMARFPFAMKISGTGERRTDIGALVRRRFEAQASRLFDFNDLDWANLWCWSQDKPDAAARFADAPPKLGKADLCLVLWRRSEPKTMLVGAVAADGGDWVRDASRPICRALVDDWLKMPGSSVPYHAVDYAACVLVHDPDRGSRGARNTVVEHIYEVRPDHDLAVID